MRMSASVLPSEVLQEIFRRLSGRDVAACRRVCRRWEHAVDSAGETFWKELCAKDYKEIYDKAHNKSGLSWRELHSSLTLWDNIAAANVRICVASALKARKFRILKNGVIACPQKRINNSNLFDYDCIVYYSVKTLEVRRKELFDFKFHNYEENDTVIVIGFIRDSNEMIRVIPKLNKKEFLELQGSGISLEPWVLLQNEVRYPCPENKLSVVKFLKKGKNFTFTKEIINDFKHGNFACDSAVSQLPNIPGVATEFKYANVFIVGTYKPVGLVYIFSNIEVNQNKMKPDKTINLNKHLRGVEDEYNYKELRQIDVVEMANGHYIVVLYRGRLVVIELSHDVSSDGTTSPYTCVLS